MTAAARASRRAAVASVGLALALGPPPAAASREGVSLRPIEGARAATAARLARGGEGGELRLVATALPIGRRGDELDVLLVVEVDTRGLATGARGPRLGFELSAYALRGDGQVAAAVSEAVVLELESLGPELSTGGLRWMTRLDLPAGSYRLRVHARDHFGGLDGLREVALQLPRRTDPATIVPAVAAQGVWVDAVSPRLEAADLERIAAQGGPPSAQPVLSASGRFRFSGWSVGRPSPPVEAILYDDRGRPVQTAVPRVYGDTAVADGVRKFELEIDLPDREGEHALRLRTGSEATPAPPVRLMLRRGEAVAWNRLAAPVPSARAAAATPAGASAAGRSPVYRRAAGTRALRAGYLEAWQAMAAGDVQGALAGLVALEQAEGGKQVVERLEETESDLLAEIARSRPRALRPLVPLYRELERAHLAGGRPELARRATTVVARLAYSLAEAAATDEDRVTAALAYESLAGDLFERGVKRTAVEMLRRGAELDPDRPEPWLALGILLERDRELEPALAAFDRALAVRPDHREARLRRARCRLLLARDAASEEELERLANGPERDWVGVVAWQERARRWFDRGEYALAAERLATAAEAYPAEPSVLLALSYARHRAGRRSESRAAATRAAELSPEPGTAPRKLYAEPPRAWFAARRAAVASLAASGAGELAAALEPTERGAR